MNDAEYRFMAFQEHGVLVPSRQTLNYYGLTAQSWLAILECQGWKCPICERTSPEVKFGVDHAHIKNWKRMPRSERATHVRGVLCLHCNAVVVGRNTDPERMRQASIYLENHERRRNASHSSD